MHPDAQKIELIADIAIFSISSAAVALTSLSMPVATEHLPALASLLGCAMLGRATQHWQAWRQRLLEPTEITVLRQAWRGHDSRALAWGLDQIALCLTGQHVAARVEEHVDRFWRYGAITLELPPVAQARSQLLLDQINGKLCLQPTAASAPQVHERFRERYSSNMLWV